MLYLRTGLGEGVAVGDVSGDGLNDLILPAPFAANPEGQQDAGRTYVVISPAGHSRSRVVSPCRYYHGVDDGDQLGHVPVTGDIDGDDREDVILVADEGGRTIRWILRERRWS